MIPTYYLDTEDGHNLAVYEQGNLNGPCVIYLHGGPGGSISEKVFEYFDLSYWHVVAFDQRGCGLSTPFASLVNNTVAHSVEDIERLRKRIGKERVSVFGGSYGTTLALSYAIKYSTKVTNLILRGIFLGRKQDINWLYQEGASHFYPQEHERFKMFIQEEKRHDLVAAYYEIFKGDDESLKLEAAKIWADWENSVVLLIPQKIDNSAAATQKDISLALLECHYFANAMFWENENMILDNIDNVRHIPTYIVHGRYDVDCTPSSAFELSKHLDNCHLEFASASGHSGFEPEIQRLLSEIMEDLKHEEK